MDKHPLQKAQHDLDVNTRTLVRLLDLRKSSIADTGVCITTTSAYLKLKDAMNQLEFMAQAGAVDDTAQISTTLTEGMATLQAEGLVLVDWIDWTGSKCPLTAGTVVDVKTRDGKVHAALTCGEDNPAADTHWSPIGWDCDIVAYRVVSTARVHAERAEVAA